MPPKVKVKIKNGLPDFTEILNSVQRKSGKNINLIYKFDESYLQKKYDAFDILCDKIYNSNLPNEAIYIVGREKVWLHIVIDGMIKQQSGWTIGTIDIFNLYVMNLIWKKYSYLLDNKKKKK